MEDRVFNQADTDLMAAISAMLEQLRPGSIQASVLEAMVNKPVNGLPRMTYDLELANKQFEKAYPGFQVPTIWELIGLDVCPYPGLWDQVEFARSNAKAIRGAVYKLKEQFETLNPEDDDTVRPIALYIFNKNGPDYRDVNVVTPMPTYADAINKCQGKQYKQVRSRVRKVSERSRIAGKEDQVIVRELASVLHNSVEGLELLGLGDELKKLENDK